MFICKLFISFIKIILILNKIIQIENSKIQIFLKILNLKYLNFICLYSELILLILKFLMFFLISYILKKYKP